MRTLLILALAVGPALAHAEEAYPISGSISSAVAFNQGQFTDLGSQEGGTGWTRGTISGSVSYATPLKGLGVSASFAVQKPLDESFARASGATQPGKTEISDVGLGLSYMIAEVGPASFNAGLDFTVPLSQASQSAGLITSIAPGLSASVKLPGGLSLNAGAGLGFNVLEEPTVQIDCAEFGELCAQIGGAGGLGIPNSRVSFSANGGLGWATPLPGLNVRGGYSWGTGLSAVEFPKDEFTSEFAQTGTQLQGDSHGTNFGISYTPSPLNTPEVAEGEDPPKPEGAWAVLSRFTLSVGMSTRQSFYDSRGQDVTVPLFDFETGTQSRTSYSISLSAAL